MGKFRRISGSNFVDFPRCRIRRRKGISKKLWETFFLIIRTEMCFPACLVLPEVFNPTRNSMRLNWKKSVVLGLSRG